MITKLKLNCPELTHLKLTWCYKLKEIEGLTNAVNLVEFFTEHCSELIEPVVLFNE